MKAKKNKIYAQILNNKVHWIFTINELPEWNNDMYLAIDITSLVVKPEIGWDYINGSFSAPIDIYMIDLSTKTDAEIAALAASFAAKQTPPV
jgi:hypothetical protein